MGIVFLTSSNSSKEEMLCFHSAQGRKKKAGSCVGRCPLFAAQTCAFLCIWVVFPSREPRIPPSSFSPAWKVTVGLHSVTSQGPARKTYGRYLVLSTLDIYDRRNRCAMVEFTRISRATREASRVPHNFNYDVTWLWKWRQNNNTFFELYFQIYNSNI